MQFFSIREKGYDVSEVDKTLARIRAEYEEKLRKQDEELTKTKISFATQLDQKNNQIKSLEQKLEKLHEIIDDYEKREEKTNNILEATSKLKFLEAQRLQILYKKWNNLLKDLKNKVVPFISQEELLEISQDFDYALKLIVDTSSEDKSSNQSYVKNLLSRMNGKKLAESEKIVTKKYVSKITSNSVEEKFVQEEVVVGEPSQAERFLSGNNVSIPKSLGMGKETLNLPNKQKKEKKDKNFSMEEALIPKESLSEIMTVFNLDD